MGDTKVSPATSSTVDSEKRVVDQQSGRYSGQDSARYTRTLGLGVPRWLIPRPIGPENFGTSYLEISEQPRFGWTVSILLCLILCWNCEVRYLTTLVNTKTNIRSEDFGTLYLDASEKPRFGLRLNESPRHRRQPRFGWSATGWTNSTTWDKTSA